jgi:hypothetical protein
MAKSDRVSDIADLDHIFHHNGTHWCLVYEAMGPSGIAVSMDRVSGEVVMDGQN